MKIKNLSFSSRTVADNPYKWAYELEDIGYSGWEIVQEGPQSLNEENLVLLQDIYETTDLKLTIHLPFSDMNLACLNDSIHREIIRQLFQDLQMASEYVDLAVIHPGHYSPYGAQVPSLAWKRNIESLQIISDAGEELGIRIAVENMPDVMQIMGRRPQEMIEILDSVNRDNIYMTFDVGHANTNGNIDEFISMCSNRIRHVHIHDNMGKRDEHLPAGKGNIDWKNLVKKLPGHKCMFVTEMGDLEDGIESVSYLKNL
ncbi:Xylose isomerase domain protein TIM barrel [Methanosalsum zhilinae DSM 4017]|uniref:Xylose isomerase domain protein TIM barrel n=1 Tax=Methanosalsum zhilinae (strain DSM 4017 / NBRC 107636 / OCM 62 / WeN5) TaxID=679901 RepID=F7XL28_METZD|nr:sugar phosphate isomerase/epimerase family protein [Methanosalsum zhilinae]AEH61840.1 Xylose isomerase domain protein TIM barrel [Methanosalsum zhilinae DSM 4017]